MGMRKSLLKKTQPVYIVVIIVMVLPVIFSLAFLQYQISRYNSIITNASLANEINKVAKNDIPIELWDIVSGRKNFNQGNQYEMVARIRDGIDTMMLGTKNRMGHQQLVVASRALHTLESNVSILGVQIAQGESVSKNEKALDEIRSITELLSEILGDFIILEIESAAIMNTSVRTSSYVIIFVQIAIMLAAVAFLVRRFQSMTQNSINEQKNLQKAEMKALQAQITPHFLYNTFDTIIWLAEEGETEKIVKVTSAFSQFLRTSLSRGHEWITVQQELAHVHNYLTIQKIRYADILNYEIEADEALTDFTMLKLTLQPLVENAIYHGIKNKRGRGQVKVTAQFTDSSRSLMKFSVQDNGVGFSEERLGQVRAELKKSASETETLTSVYGLYNVSKRLELYYGTENAGIKIESEYGKGALVYFTVPCRPLQDS